MDDDGDVEYEEIEVSEYEEVVVDDDGDAAADADDFGEDGDFGADDDAAFDDDGGGGWDDDDEPMDDVDAIPLRLDGNDSSSEQYQLDRDGNVVSPMELSRRQSSLSRQRSSELQCWRCPNCAATNKLSWTLTVEQFLHKCCICRQPTYSPVTTKVFESEQWDEPSNDHWGCARCTLHNAIGRNVCSACSHPQDTREATGGPLDDDDDDGLFQRDESSDDGDGAAQQNLGGHSMSMMGGGGGLNVFGGAGGGFGGGGIMGIDRGRFGGAHSSFNAGHRRHGGPMGRPRQRARPRDVRPLEKRSEGNLRNLLILGFVRKHCRFLPSKFWRILSDYYQGFDRWDWDRLQRRWTTKRRDIVSIRRSRRAKAQWSNMFGLDAVRYAVDRADSDKKWAAANPPRFSWTLRLIDRLAADTPKNEESGDVAMAQRENEKKESFELQFVDVIVGVVDSGRMPREPLSDAFYLHDFGHGLFAGNGKVLEDGAGEWTKCCAPLQNGDTLSVHVEWMKRGQFHSLYAVEEADSKNETAADGQPPADKGDEDWVVALSFARNEADGMSPRHLKGSVSCLPAAASYKLAVSAAMRRWEIEWVSARWTERVDVQQAMGRED